jgi:Flp pilus assembly protein TadG
MYALIAPVLVLGAGAAIGYGRAAQIHTKLNAAADAAALAALTPAMLQQSATVAQAAASAMFTGLADGVSGLAKNATKVTVTITTGANPLIRDVEVSYTTSVNTIFAQVLGMAQLSVQGAVPSAQGLPAVSPLFVPA